MATPRKTLVRLLDAHTWCTPKTHTEARELHATLGALLKNARLVDTGDRVAHLVTLRLELFLTHWPHHPRGEEQFRRFKADAKTLCRHDIPRLRRTLLWSPAELPEQRTPRLAVCSLNTA